MKVKYTCSAMPFKQMENIATFLHALSKLPNFRSFDLFSTVDLYEGKNMAQVVRCVLACKRFAEKEAVLKGIEVLKVTEEFKKHEVEWKDEAKDKVHDELKDEPKFEDKDEEPKAMDQAINIDDFMEITEPEIETVEQSEKESSKDEEMEIEQKGIDESDLSHPEPEIILIDSPVLADDESDDHKHLEETYQIEEEYETFTQENPGTFEIQVSN